MRSGTSLLYRLLNHHPQISLFYEADIFALSPLLWPSWRKGVWSQRLEFWNGVLSRHGINDAASRAQLPGNVHGTGEAFQALCRVYGERRPTTYIGSKSIHYCGYLPEIARMFPAARFVVLHRSVAGIIDSVRRAGATNAYLAPARRRRQILLQYGEMAAGVAALRRLGSAVHEVAYRDLAANAETVCRQLCDFLELPWAPEMLAHDPARLSAIPDAPHHFHARNTQAGHAPKRLLDISPGTAAQIRAYEDYWVAKFAGQPVELAPRSPLPPGPPSRAFAVRRRVDRGLFALQQAGFFAKLLIYRFAPLALLRRYRASHRRKTRDGVA